MHNRVTKIDHIKQITQKERSQNIKYYFILQRIRKKSGDSDSLPSSAPLLASSQPPWIEMVKQINMTLVKHDLLCVLSHVTLV
jgi:hypothetical protein